MPAELGPGHREGPHASVHVQPGSGPLQAPLPPPLGLWFVPFHPIGPGAHSSLGVLSALSAVSTGLS